MATKIIPDSVREILNYDKDTGILTWKVDRRNGIKAGDVAGVVGGKGYVQIGFLKKRWYAHRLAWFLAHGEQPEVIDHINRDKTDNRLQNLRNVDASTNMLNVEKKGFGFYEGYWQCRYGGKKVYHGKNILMGFFRLTMAHRARLPIGIPNL